MTSAVSTISLLTTPPGNLAYHLVLLFAIGGAFQAALVQWRRYSYPQTHRLLLGLTGLLLARFVLFAAAAVAWQGALPFHAFVPVVDRAVAAASLLLLIWLWAYPEADRRADFLLLAFLSLIVFLAVGTEIWWAQTAAFFPFNSSAPDRVWAFLNVLVALAGLLLLARRKPDGHAIGFLFFAVLAIAWAFHAFLPPSQGDFDGFVRLAELLVYPFIFILPYRFRVEHLSSPRLVVQKPAFDDLPKTAFMAFAEVLDLPPGEHRCFTLAEAIARFMRADLCLILEPPAGERLNFACGYDLIRNLPLEGKSLFVRALPVVTAALEKRRLLRLPASSTSRDLKAIAFALNLPHTGPLLVAPLPPEAGVPLQGAIVLLSPYAQHAWTASEENSLAEVARHVGRWLAAEQGKGSGETESAAALAEALEQSKAENSRLKAAVEECGAVQERLQSLAKAYDEMQNLLDQARAQAGTLEERFMQESAKRREAERALQGALKQLEQLKVRLAEVAEASQRESLTSKATGAALSQDAIEYLISGVQDFRQPLSAVTGYADLLLADGAQNLSPTQRDFLKRIRVAAARLEQLLDDLLQVLALDSGKLIAHPDKVDPVPVLEESLERVLPLAREREQFISVQLPDHPLAVRAEAHLLRQVMQILIRNALLATPPQRTVRVSLAEVAENGSRYLRFEVEDSGGGIPEEHLASVFTRDRSSVYRLISGVGDHGVGLPLVKALVEAQEGRIWVTSKMGKGSVFTVLLPAGAVDEQG